MNLNFRINNYELIDFLWNFLERRAKTIVLAFFKVVAINQIFPQIGYKIN